MLKIFGESGGRLCDGGSRRDFLKIGGLAFGGLSLPQLLQTTQARIDLIARKETS